MKKIIQESLRECISFGVKKIEKLNIKEVKLRYKI